MKGYGKYREKVSKSNKYKQSKHKVEKNIIVGVPAAIAAAVTCTLLYSLLKGKTHRESARRIADATNDVLSGFVDNSSKAFAGLTQSILDCLAKETTRSVKATVQGNSVEYMYKSASGKTINSASFKLDGNNNLIWILGNNS